MICPLDETDQAPPIETRGEDGLQPIFQVGARTAAPCLPGRPAERLRGVPGSRELLGSAPFAKAIGALPAVLDGLGRLDDRVATREPPNEFALVGDAPAVVPSAGWDGGELQEVHRQRGA